MECYEQHMQDSRIRGPLKKIPSLSSSGGGQQGMSVLIRDKAEFLRITELIPGSRGLMKSVLL